MSNLDNYLEYLSEAKPTPFSVAGEVESSMYQGALWSFIAIPSVVLAWKAANALLSQADRNCGGFAARRTPGFHVCVARERIKIFQRQISVARTALSQCRMTKNPAMCQQKWKLEIEKANNRIQIQKDKISGILGESQNLNEFIGQGVVGLGISFITMDALDRVIFLVRRSAQATYSKSIRKCGIYKTGAERDLCMTKIKLDAQQNELARVAPLLGKCNRTNNPDACKESIGKKISLLQRNIQISKDNITSYGNQADTDMREKALKAKKKSGG